MTHEARRPDMAPMGQPGGKPGYVYEWVAQDLAARIESGELAPHTPLPSERRLAQEYGVSLGSARHATRLLRFRGLVVTVKSKGTYVADRARN
ncbi:winged helix-turn-helix domain-containing protein [Amycolatopsis acidiphila]|nr:winged helix-turn-helix domain-containing protein [Amycolatopsis acidiphila]UIJ63796.1 winged helix-turn-helix domain-containing protein [Amycolatopsis acidiphila]